MRQVSVEEFAGLVPSALRLAESKYLYDCFLVSGSAPHNQTLFLMTTYFDAFLFCIVSIEEMVDEDTRSTIQALPIFRFFKALRNITTHHSVLTGIKDSKFPRPIARHLAVGVGCTIDEAARFFIIPDKLNFIFDEIIKERKREKPTIELARQFLASMVKPDEHLYVSDLMSKVMHEIEPHVS